MTFQFLSFFLIHSEKIWLKRRKLSLSFFFGWKYLLPSIYNSRQYFVVFNRFCIRVLLRECKDDKGKMRATTMVHFNFIDHCIRKLNKNHCLKYLKRMKVDFEMAIIVWTSPARPSQNFVPGKSSVQWNVIRTKFLPSRNYAINGFFLMGPFIYFAKHRTPFAFASIALEFAV